MLPTTITHYAPWTESDDDVARCGHEMTETDTHSGQPTCGACVAGIIADEVQLDLELTFISEPLDDETAARELDPVLNAGVPVREPETIAAELFAWGVDLVRASYFPPEARLFAGRRRR